MARYPPRGAAPDPAAVWSCRRPAARGSACWQIPRPGTGREQGCRQCPAVPGRSAPPRRRDSSGWYWRHPSSLPCRIVPPGSRPERKDTLPAASPPQHSGSIPWLSCKASPAPSVPLQRKTSVPPQGAEPKRAVPPGDETPPPSFAVIPAASAPAPGAWPAGWLPPPDSANRFCQIAREVPPFFGCYTL